MLIIKNNYKLYYYYETNFNPISPYTELHQIIKISFSASSVCFFSTYK